MIAISYRTSTYEVHDADVATLAAQLDGLENVPGAAATAAGLRNPVNGQDVPLDDAAAIAIVLAFIQSTTTASDRIQLGAPGYRLRALRRGLEGELWPQAAHRARALS
jgi:hypothetical protein